ncbi:MAG: MFS transporter [Pseudomonadota bacterium]
MDSHATPSAVSNLDQPRGWIVALAAMFCLTFGPSALLVTGFGVFVRPVAQEFNWSIGQVSFAVSLIALTVMVISPLQGILLDRFGVRRVVLTSIPCFVLGLMAMNWLPRNLQVYYLAWVTLPILAIGLWPASYLKTVSGWFEKRLGLAVGVANAGIGIGAIVVSPIAAALVGAFGWRRAFIGLGLLALLTLPVAALLVRENSAQRVAPAIAGSALTVRALLANRNFRILACGYFFVGITGTSMIANLLPILLDSGMAQQRAVGVMSLFGVAALVGRIGTGFLLDRWFVAHVLNVFVFGSALATAGYAMGATGSVAVIAAVLLGLITGAEFDALAYAVRRYFGMASFGKIYGIVFGAFQLGASMGAALIAISLQRTGNYHLAMWVFSGALLLAFVIFVRLTGYPNLAATSSAENSR